MSHECKQCYKVGKEYQLKYGDEDFFTVHTLYQRVKSNIRGKNARDCKAEIRLDLALRVCALRNTDGGVILLHVEGGSWAESKWLQFFDEFIGSRLDSLLEDGQDLARNFTRRVLPEIPGFQDYANFIYLRVEKTAGVCTLEFNTKIGDDHQVNPATSSKLKLILSQPPVRTNETATLNGLPQDTQDLQENRSIQLKSFPNDTDVDILKDSTKLVDFIWSRMRLKDYITSMSKLINGGSYYIGVSETKENKPVIYGFELKVREEDFRESFKTKLHSSTCVLDIGKKFHDVPSNLVALAFYKLPSDRYVLEVAVRYFDGIVFYDKLGPEAYKVEKKEVCRMDRTEWLTRLLKENPVT